MASAPLEDAYAYMYLQINISMFLEWVILLSIWNHKNCDKKSVDICSVQIIFFPIHVTSNGVCTSGTKVIFHIYPIFALVKLYMYNNCDYNFLLFNKFMSKFNRVDNFCTNPYFSL